MMRSLISCVGCALLMALLLGSVAHAEVVIETVPVGNTANSANSHGEGAVSYDYRIGKYEVTAAQYCEFLNAVAKTDTYGLYNTLMWTATGNQMGCKIQQAGSSGSYAYSVASDWGNRPVNYVSWGDAARFANWLQNGQPTGSQDSTTTEDGAYYLNGATSETALMAVIREADWTWAIVSNDEWVKAGYHKNDGDTGNYWKYPTSSQTTPSNNWVDPDAGNNVTCLGGVSTDYTIGEPYYRTVVGEHENSESPYDTFDQGGNVLEWTEACDGAAARRTRGGHYASVVANMEISSAWQTWVPASPTAEWRSVGIRLVNVPEPATMGLVGLGVVFLVKARRRK